MITPLLSLSLSLLLIRYRKSLGWKPILSVTGDEVSGLLIANQLAGSQYQDTLFITHCSSLIAHYSLLVGYWLPASNEGMIETVGKC